ncbi:response regulator [Legionella taurinensis]|uniref:Response regulator n=1 Tax=Legionella taurinensis TaxID=70611 RepID=A0A3A5L2Y2_9GAMM|nr:response regulator [Legionella taurinensis]MDX1836339.1 response regulator [Legionella taurinensis]PUT41911.1 response regulator [Legionella taurinensis]PUT44700.1 response regulator [Legionella taurinensis]PUT48020.1 response regulator [Legionella taurinensis]PUT48833.1 response regulator [Legionella taurinensis]
MRVLIVEDNAFNAFCLTRLLQSVQPAVQVTVVNDSLNALNVIESDEVSLVIVDGDLGASDGLLCNGPALADALWELKPSLPVIAWTDSEMMRSAFAETFKQQQKCFNDIYCWPKIVSQERISLALNYLGKQTGATPAANLTAVTDTLHA